jgi:hypothetical protein
MSVRYRFVYQHRCKQPHEAIAALNDSWAATSFIQFWTTSKRAVPQDVVLETGGAMLMSGTTPELQADLTIAYSQGVRTIGPTTD